MKPNFYFYVAILRDDPGRPRVLLSPITKVHISKLQDLPRVPVGIKRKIWRCGDKASEDVYREQGWFPA